MAEAIITRKGVNITKSFSPNEYELIGDYTVSGSAITSYTFSGLKINTDEEVILVSDIYNTSASNTTVNIIANGNSTASNYYIQRLKAELTTISGARANTQFYCEVNNNQKTYALVNIKLTNNGYFVFQSNVSQNYGTSSIFIDLLDVTSTFTLSQITSLTITSSVASTIGIGSRFQLYKVKGQVQQTWATT